MILVWLAGLVRTRRGRLAGVIAGTAMVVALSLDLVAFLDQSSRSMTARALQTATTDWQVELVPGADLAKVEADLAAAVQIQSIQPVGYAAIDAFEFTSGNTTQTTGAGKAVGLPPGYFDTRRNDVRLLSGDMRGALLLQQTAANLHAAAGDTILVRRPGAADATIVITGIIDLRTADAFFQAVGLPPGAAPVAPPDNAVLMPADTWHAIFDPQASARPDSVRTQLHAALDRSQLPADPNDAFSTAASLGRNFEARVAGAAFLANNLAAQLDAARGDALYARVLFLFLGIPGIVLGAMLTLIIGLSGTRTRQRDLALLKLRGASAFESARYLLVEAVTVATIGTVTGVALAAAVAVLAGGVALDALSPVPIGVALVCGLLLSIVTILGPGFVTSMSLAIAGMQTTEFRPRRPLWDRFYIDLLMIAGAGVVFWQTAAGGYQIVLATEGVTATAVNYWAFLAPVLLWVGAGLLTVRLARLALARGRKSISRGITPLAGAMAPAVASALSWQRRRIGMGAALTALALAFLTSTAVFNATYESQARVDAQLTNGADVTLTGTTASPAGKLLSTIRKLSGVQAAEAMQHRYAYVGMDLQDLYGIDPTTIGQATTLSNAFFQGNDASSILTQLSHRADAILVSEETVSDFHLVLGDTLNLRLQGKDGSYNVVPFVFAGVVREFPTAPRDSFLVGNASYISRATGIDAAEIVLARTADPKGVKDAAEVLVKGQPIRVTSLLDAVHVIGSSLTAVDLKGLSGIELTFAVFLGMGATALVLALGFADRRRDFAVLRVLGAESRQLSSFVWAEATFVLAIGTVAGGGVGWIVSQILIVTLQGVFDPPPEAPTVPWAYLSMAILAIFALVSLVAYSTVRAASLPSVNRLRDDS